MIHSWIALAAPLVLAASGPGLTGEELLEGLQYRQDLLGELVVEYSVENRVHEAGVEVLKQYRSEAANALGEGSGEIPEAGSKTEFLRWATDGERYRFSGFEEVDGEGIETFRIAFDGKLFQSYVAHTGTGQVMGQFAPLHNHPNELGLAPKGRFLMEHLDGKSIYNVESVVLEGVPCYLMEARGPHDTAPGATELIRLWVDPRRGFAVLRAEFGGELARGEQILREMPSYALEVTELREISPGLWYPLGGVLQSYISPDSTTLNEPPTGAGLVEWERELLVEDEIRVQQVRTRLGEEDSLGIDWPAGTQILDTVANKLFVAGGLEGELKAAAQRIKVGGKLGDLLAAPLTAEGKDLELEAINPDQDCGLRAVYLALGVLDHNPDWQALLDFAGSERERGVSLKTLEEIAQNAGAQTLGLRVSDFDALPKDTPTILYLRGDNLVLDETHAHGGEGHFLLALKRGKDRLDLYDPLEAKRGASVTLEKLRSAWYGEVLLVSNEALAVPASSGGKQELAWWVTGILLSLMVGGVFWSRRKISRTPARATAASLLFGLALSSSFFLATSASAEAGPKIHFEETRVDFGRVWASQGLLRHTFRYTNEGNQDLLIKLVQSSCDCTTVGDSTSGSVVKPGESKELVVQMDLLGRYGRRDAVVAIHSNDPENPVVNLRLSILVEQDISILPQKVRLGEVSAGAPSRGEVEIRLMLDEARSEASLMVAEADLPWVDVSVEARDLEEWSKDRKDRAEGLLEKAWILKLDGQVPAGASAGPFSGQISVLFDGAGEIEPLVIPIEGKIVSEYFASPAKVLFGLVPSGSKTSRTIRIKTTQDDEVEVIGYKADTQYIELSAVEGESGKQGEFLLSASLVSGAPQGRLQGEIRVDLKNGSSILVPISAVVE